MHNDNVVLSIVLAMEQSDLFRNLARRTMQEASQRFERVVVPKDTMIMQRGDTDDDIYLVISGQLRVLVDSEVSKSTAFHRVSTGAVLGEFAAIDGKPRSADVITETDSVVAKLSCENFWMLLRVYPELSMSLNLRLLTEVRALTERVALLTQRTGDARLYHFMRQHLNESGDDSGLIMMSMTQAEIAEYVGVRREAVNRYLRDWQKAGALEKVGSNYRVLDEARWYAEVEANLKA